VRDEPDRAQAREGFVPNGGNTGVDARGARNRRREGGLIHRSAGADNHHVTLLRWLSFVALMVAFWPGGSASSAQAPVYSRLSIGVVRGDGILLPLASKENETWTVLRSFSSVGDSSLYKLLDAQSVPREGWTYVPWDAGVPRPLALLNMVTPDAHCGRQEGFATNAPPPSSKLDSPHLMSGIAIHGDVSALRVEDMVHQPDAVSRRVARFVVQLTHALEAETASVPQSIPPNERERVPVQITTLARDRVGDGGAHGYVDYYYFEAHKRYRAVESYANGWLVSSQGSFSVLRTTAGIYRGGETARQRGRVLGVLRLRIRRSSVWVMEMRGYEGDTYEIVEPGSEHVLKVHGGGC
jgi:hypothetical protein